MLVLEVEVDTDDVELGPLRCFVAQQTAAVRRAVGWGMVGRVPADEVTEAGAQAQPVEHVDGELPQQDAFLQVNRVGVALPAARVYLDGDREAVDACRLLHGVRRQAGEFQAWDFFGEFPSQGRLQAGIVHRAAAAKESEHPRRPDSLTLIPQMKQVAAVSVVFTDRERGRVGSELGCCVAHPHVTWWAASEGRFEIFSVASW